MLPQDRALAVNPPVAWWREWEFYAVAVLIALVFGARMTSFPLIGEETTWASGAVEMLQTGDWVVVRQQGTLFPDRPPMTPWTMALAGWARGEVDVIAVRLPSVLATLLMSLVIYIYARAFLSKAGAVAASLAFATAGQVLQLGRLGESEAVFTFFVGSSLLVWHLGHIRQWNPYVKWTSAYALAALGTLTKGPQAPVYFVGAVGLYLLLQRNWRELLRPAHLLGGLVYVAMLLAWVIPYFQATSARLVYDTFMGLSTARFELSKLLPHLAKFPLETWGCLAPWSIMLVFIATPSGRRMVRQAQPMTLFLLAAIAVSFPTVWFASGARGRYYMPLYPCFALLAGLVIDRCAAAAPGTALRRRLRWAMAVFAGLLGTISLALAAARFWPKELPEKVQAVVDQPLWLPIALVLAGLATCWLAKAAATRSDNRWASASILMLGLVWGTFYAGVVINVQRNGYADFESGVARIEKLVPQRNGLVSFGALRHRFVYYFDRPVRELPWPQAGEVPPDDVDYFFFSRYGIDTPEQKLEGRGLRTYIVSPGTLPFEWEEVAVLPVDRRRTESGGDDVVVGRVIRDGGVARMIDRSKSPETPPAVETARRNHGVER